MEVQLPNIGVHFVLVEEKSITGIELPKNHKSFFLKYILGIISKKDIESELKAQVNKIISAGVRPVFINSHQHLHLLPGIMDMVIEIAKENNITYIRLAIRLDVERGHCDRKSPLSDSNRRPPLYKNETGPSDA